MIKFCQTDYFSLKRQIVNHLKYEKINFNNSNFTFIIPSQY